MKAPGSTMPTLRQLCTPTRVMIMRVGFIHPRTGFHALIGKDKGVRMPASIRTFGHDFRDAGYATAITGKWQLGKFDEFPNQPIEHGFDEYCMWTWVHAGKKSSRYYAPQIYSKGEITNGEKDEFGPDYFHQFALDFIDRKKNESFYSTTLWLLSTHRLFTRLSSRNWPTLNTQGTLISKPWLLGI